MTFSKRDLFFVVPAIVMVAWLALGSAQNLGPEVSNSEQHRQFYQQLDSSQRRAAQERGCRQCHALTDLSAKHPHKQECMVCHVRAQ